MSEADFYPKIDAAPADFTARLVLADWLDEAGLCARAAAWRWTAELGRVPIDWTEITYYAKGWHWDGDPTEADPSSAWPLGDEWLPALLPYPLVYYDHDDAFERPTPVEAAHAFPSLALKAVVDRWAELTPPEAALCLAWVPPKPITDPVSMK